MYPPPRLITLDLDETLWPCAPVIDAAESALLEWLREHAEALWAAHDNESLRAHRLELVARRPELAHDFTAQRHASLELLLDEHGYPEDLAARAVEVFLEARNRVEPYPDVAAALARLSRQATLVSLTNGNADVRRTPIGAYFRYTFTAGEVGAAKPSPRLFHAALEACNCPPEAALHVGDDPHLDCEAARRLGIASVWVNRHRHAWSAELERPALEVTELGALADWLGA